MVLLNSELEITGDVGTVSTPGPGVAQILCHLRNPGNLLNYMILSAWLKFMGIASHIPTVSIG